MANKEYFDVPLQLKIEKKYIVALGIASAVGMFFILRTILALVYLYAYFHPIRVNSRYDIAMNIPGCIVAVEIDYGYYEFFLRESYFYLPALQATFDDYAFNALKLHGKDEFILLTGLAGNEKEKDYERKKEVFLGTKEKLDAFVPKEPYVVIGKVAKAKKFWVKKFGERFAVEAAEKDGFPNNVKNTNIQNYLIYQRNERDLEYEVERWSGNFCFYLPVWLFFYLRYKKQEKMVEEYRKRMRKELREKKKTYDME